MKVKGIILAVLLVCAIGLSVILYSFYTQVNVTEQEACAIGEAIIAETIMHDGAPFPNPVITTNDMGRVWRVNAYCKYSEEFDTNYFVEISKRTGEVVRVRDDYLTWED